ILEGGPNGRPVKYATIGQQVYHQWICESETIDTFCMLVHSCTVDDGKGDEVVPILDANGCALDRYVLNNIEYPEDLAAGQVKKAAEQNTSSSNNHTLSNFCRQQKITSVKIMTYICNVVRAQIMEND
ncbi:unnamed protein product, partial [Cylicostephanus goldi]